jgi:cellulose synthase/poly-beta-1,6-N-acetylglucosamine synthase-like glycosyltransferase
VIVVEDGSTDDSLAVIERLAGRYPALRVLKNERNMGVVYSLNRGLGHASGDYVTFPGSDDKTLPEQFERSVALLERHPQAGVCTSLARAMSEAGEALEVRPTPVIRNTPGFVAPMDAPALLRKHDSWFANATAVYRRRVLEELGGFDPELRSYADGFMCQVIALKHGACFIPEPLALERMAEVRYSKTIMAEPGAALFIVGRATQLMQTTYRDLFPADFVDAWSNRRRYHLGLRTVLTYQRRQATGLRKLIPSPSVPDRAFFGLLRLAMKVEYIVARLYLLARVKHGGGEKVSGRES